MTEIDALRQQVADLTRERDHWKRVAAVRGAVQDEDDQLRELELLEQERDNALLAIDERNAA